MNEVEQLRANLRASRRLLRLEVERGNELEVIAREALESLKRANKMISSLAQPKEKKTTLKLNVINDE